MIAKPEDVGLRVRKQTAEVLRRLYWSAEAIYEEVDITPSRISKQLNGHDPLTLLAYAHNLEGFWPLFVCELARGFGYVVVEEPNLQHLVRTLDRIETHMLRMELPPHRKAMKA